MDIEQSVLAPTRSRTDIPINTQDSEKRVTTRLIVYAPIIIQSAKNQWSLKSSQDIFATWYQVLSLLSVGYNLEFKIILTGLQSLRRKRDMTGRLS